VFGPEAVGDGLAGSERGQRVFNRVRRAAAAAERGRLVDRECVPGGADSHFCDTGQGAVRPEQRPGDCGIVSHGLAGVYDDSSERHCGPPGVSTEIVNSIDLNCQELRALEGHLGTVAVGRSLPIRLRTSRSQHPPPLGSVIAPRRHLMLPVGFTRHEGRGKRLTPAPPVPNGSQRMTRAWPRRAVVTGVDIDCLRGCVVPVVTSR